MVMVPKINSSKALPDDVDALKALVQAERVENDRLRAIIKEFPGPIRLQLREDRSRTVEACSWADRTS